MLLQILKIILFLFVTKLLLSSVNVVVFIFKQILLRMKCNKRLPGKKFSIINPLGHIQEIHLKRNTKEFKSLSTAWMEVLGENMSSFRDDKLFFMSLSYLPVVVLSHPDAFQEFENKVTAMEKGFAYKWLEPLYGNSLALLDGMKWKARRKMILPFFQSQSLKRFLKCFNDHAIALVEKCKSQTKEEQVDAYKLARTVTEGVITEATLGLNKEEQLKRNISITDYFNRALSLSMERFLKWGMLPNFLYRLTDSGKEFIKHCQIIHRISEEAIADREKTYLSEKSGHNEGDLYIIDFFLKKHCEGILTKKDLKDEIISALGTQLPVAYALTWVLYLIGLHPSVQTRLQNELDQVFGSDKEAPVTTDHISRLTYLNCVIKESWRLFPPIPTVGKVVKNDLKICGYNIPAGVICIAPLYFLHRNAEEFEEPGRFDPSRFLPENAKKRHPFAFVPFSVGPNACIGRRFAEMQEMVVLATFLRHFNVESTQPIDNIEINFDANMRPAKPIFLNVTFRK